MFVEEEMVGILSKDLVKSLFISFEPSINLGEFSPRDHCCYNKWWFYNKGHTILFMQAAMKSVLTLFSGFKMFF